MFVLFQRNNGSCFPKTIQTLMWTWMILDSNTIAAHQMWMRFDVATRTEQESKSEEAGFSGSVFDLLLIQKCALYVLVDATGPG